MFSPTTAPESFLGKIGEKAKKDFAKWLGKAGLQRDSVTLVIVGR